MPQESPVAASENRKEVLSLLRDRLDAHTCEACKTSNRGCDAYNDLWDFYDAILGEAQGKALEALLEAARAFLGAS